MARLRALGGAIRTPAITLMVVAAAATAACARPPIRGFALAVDHTRSANQAELVTIAQSESTELLTEALIARSPAVVVTIAGSYAESVVATEADFSLAGDRVAKAMTDIEQEARRLQLRAEAIAGIEAALRASPAPQTDMFGALLKLSEQLDDRPGAMWECTIVTDGMATADPWNFWVLTLDDAGIEQVLREVEQAGFLPAALGCATVRFVGIAVTEDGGLDAAKTAEVRAFWTAYFDRLGIPVHFDDVAQKRPPGAAAGTPRNLSAPYGGHRALPRRARRAAGQLGRPRRNRRIGDLVHRFPVVRLGALGQAVMRRGAGKDGERDGEAIGPLLQAREGSNELELTAPSASLDRIDAVAGRDVATVRSELRHKLRPLYDDLVTYARQADVIETRLPRARAEHEAANTALERFRSGLSPYGLQRAIPRRLHWPLLIGGLSGLFAALRPALQLLGARGWEQELFSLGLTIALLILCQAGKPLKLWHHRERTRALREGEAPPLATRVVTGVLATAIILAAPAFLLSVAILRLASWQAQTALLKAIENVNTNVDPSAFLNPRTALLVFAAVGIVEFVAFTGLAFFATSPDADEFERLTREVKDARDTEHRLEEQASDLRAAQARTYNGIALVKAQYGDVILAREQARLEERAVYAQAFWRTHGRPDVVKLTEDPGPSTSRERSWMQDLPPYTIEPLTGIDPPEPPDYARARWDENGSGSR